ncbi:MAG: right-handed parallel beta-helix repeat-containing protein [Verrucomicrobiales bacterium]|nr:right-handed parallel beta-helix repeat-containing protein [Verrucomicrobiales bacterium]
MAETFEIMKHHHSVWVAGAILVGLLFGSCALADFYVSPSGSDAGAGTIARPFASLEKARDAVRAAKQSSPTRGGAVTVWLRGGDFVRTNALALSALDSGSEAAPVVWRAYGNERVRLLGGRILDGFQPVTNPAVLSRLDEAARNHVLELDLRARGISNFGEMHSRGFGRATTPAHCELFFAHRPMTLARWPNEGWEKLAGFPPGAAKGDDHGGSIGDLPGGFTYAGDRPRHWQDTTDLWVHGFWAWDWANSYERVASLDLEKRIVQTAAPHGLYGFRAGQRFCWLNVLEELDQPGEWFLDRQNGVLYFWPPAPLSSGETLLSVLDQPLIKMTDARHITVQGLTLEATRGSGVEITGGAGNRIVGCRLRNLGNLGVVINGGTNHGVASCDLFDTGDGGVSLTGGDRQTLTPGGHFVENSHFQRQARWSKCYAPCVLLSGVGLRVSHNQMHDHPHCAILFTGNNHLLEFNDIHHIALETGDVGAIYTGRDYTFRGNRIRHNFIHETGGVGMGSMGVYMDDCVSGTEVFGNVFYKVHWAMFIGGGRDHRIENNLFVDCDPAIRADGRGLDPAPVWRGMVDSFMRQQLAAVPAALYRERYPAMKTLDAYYGPLEGPSLTGAAFEGIPPEGNIITRNVCVGKWFDVGWHAITNQFELRDNYITTDPKQVGAAADGFPIAPESPIWKTNFKSIPFGQIGIQPNPDRRRLARFD